MAEEDEIRGNPSGDADLPPPEEDEADIRPDVESTTDAVTAEDGVTARPTHPERQPGGPYVESLSSQPEDLGRRWLQGATQAPPTPGSYERSPNASEPDERLVTYLPDDSGVEDRRGRRPPEADRDTPYTPDPGLTDRREHLVTERSPGTPRGSEPIPAGSPTGAVGNRPESRLQALFAHKIARSALAGGMVGLGIGFLHRASLRRRRDQA